MSKPNKSLQDVSKSYYLRTTITNKNYELYLFHRVHIASFWWTLSIRKYFPQSGTKCPNICCYRMMSIIKIRVTLCWNPVDTAKSFKIILKTCLLKPKGIYIFVECLDKIQKANEIMMTVVVVVVILNHKSNLFLGVHLTVFFFQHLHLVMKLCS
jgi:hypothetical protein